MAENKHNMRLPSFARRLGRKLSNTKLELLSTVKAEKEIILPQNEMLHLDKLFDKTRFREIWLEIGFGNGEFLANNCKTNPDVGFIGCEPYVHGLANFLKNIPTLKLNNVFVFNNDARLLLDKIPDHSLGRVYVLFPDPWPKAKHHKRRIISKEFLSLLYMKLVKGGRVIVATDHEEYAAWVLEHFLGDNRYKARLDMRSDWQVEPENWTKTKYQQKAESIGVRPYFFAFSII